MEGENYIHGTTPREQARLALLNSLTNPSFLEFLELRSSDQVLEIGSGLGILTREVAMRVPQGKACGVERSSAQNAEANRRNDLPNLYFLEGDAQNLPFEAPCFDVVYCRYLLEHVPDPLRVLKEARRVLKPGGKLFLQENNIAANFMDPACPRFEHVWNQFIDLQAKLGGDALIGKKLFGLLKRAGFEDVALSLAPEVHWHGEAMFRNCMENLIGNVDGARASLSASDVDGAIAELKEFIINPEASAIFYWNRAKAIGV